MTPDATILAASSLVDAHQVWAWVVVAANALVGAWALAAHSVHRLRGRALWWSVGAAEMAMLVQVVLGVVLVNQQQRELVGMHAFYGFVAIAAAGIIYSYRQQLRGRWHLLYGWGSLFLAGLALRAIYLPPG